MNTATSTAARTIPGPHGLPYVGPYWHYIRFLRDPIGDMKTRFQKFGAISAAPVESEDGKRTAVFAFGPAFNQQVLSNPTIFHSPMLGGSPGSAQERLGAGLVFMNGDHHKQHRRLMIPVFHKKYIDAYQADMVRLTDLELKRWELGDQRDVAHDMQRLTMRIANHTLFGLAADHEEDNLGSLMRQWLALNVSPFARIVPVNRLNLPYHRLVQISDTGFGYRKTICRNGSR